MQMHSLKLFFRIQLKHSYYTTGIWSSNSYPDHAANALLLLESLQDKAQQEMLFCNPTSKNRKLWNLRRLLSANDWEIILQDEMQQKQVLYYKLYYINTNINRFPSKTKRGSKEKSSFQQIEVSLIKAIHLEDSRKFLVFTLSPKKMRIIVFERKGRIFQ